MCSLREYVLNENQIGMSDPNFQAESATESQNRPDQRNSQLESDEQYARQLAAHLHQTSIPRNQSLRTSADQSTPRSRGNGDPSYNELHDDKDYSFFDGLTNVLCSKG